MKVLVIGLDRLDLGYPEIIQWTWTEACSFDHSVVLDKGLYKSSLSTLSLEGKNTRFLLYSLPSFRPLGWLPCPVVDACGY